MPSADSPARSLRVRSPMLARAARSPGRSRAPGRGDGGHDGPSCSGAGVGDDVPVEHLDAPTRPGGDRVVVGDDDDRGTRRVEFFQQLQDGGAGGRVQVPGRLISQHHRRRARYRPGDRDPLPLAPRQLGRPGGGPVRQPDPGQRVCRQPPPLAAADAGVQQPVGHVAQHALVLGEEELLEHEPDPGRPQRRQLPVPHPRHVQAGDAYRPGRRPVQGAHQVQQRGLARPGRADHRHQLPGRHRQARLIQRPHRRRPGVLLDHPLQLQHRNRRRGHDAGLPGHLRAAGHDAGTTTRCPGVSAPVTCTSPSASSKIPGVTGTQRRVFSGPTTSTTYPPED